MLCIYAIRIANILISFKKFRIAIYKAIVNKKWRYKAAIKIIISYAKITIKSY
jgi:hypothetical protein